MACIVGCSLFLAEPASAACCWSDLAACDTAIMKRNSFCAGLASIMTVAFVHPCDFVKTRVQIASSFGTESSIAYTLSQTMKKEGVHAFFKGL